MDWMIWMVIALVALCSVIKRLDDYCGWGYFSPEYRGMTFRRALLKGFCLGILYAVFFWLIWPIRWISENPEGVCSVLAGITAIVTVVIWLVMLPFRLIAQMPRFFNKLRLNPVLNGH